MLRGISHESDVGSGDINAHVTRIPVADNDADHRVIVPDTELLFSAKFLKSGSDLVLVGENGHKIVLSGYFDHARHADLVAPGGAILTADVVAKLTISQTPGQYAQAGAPAGAVVIGKVERIGGSATVQHANGTVEELKIGDNVYQGDVVETGSGSQLGMSFIDGTAFNMGAAARMVLSELLYDANSNSNSGVFSLVKGTISFVAGKVAKTGDMRVDTPVATMGIRGTSVNTNITTDVGGNTVSVTYSLMRDPDGHVGSFNILDRVSGAIIGTITTTDTTFVVTPTANLGVLATQLNKSPEQIAQELATAQALFPIFLANPANFNSQNVNPQNGSHGSSSPPPGGSQQNFNNTGPTKTGPGGVTIIDDGDDPSGTGNVHVVIHVNTPPSVFADTPSHLVEAVSLGAAGTDTTSSHITKLDLDGTVSYDVAALANAGWIDVGNGIYSKLGTYGAASLNTGVASVASLVAAGWHDLGNGYLEKAVSFGAAGNETIRISSGADSVTYALDNAKADSLRQIDHPTETFAIPVVDNSLATATTNVVFTIDGENDPPAVVLGSTNTTGGVTEDANPNVLTSTGTITFRDPELTDAHTATAVFTSSTSDLPGFVNNTTHIGTFTVDANATENTADTNNIGTFGWRFDLDDSNPVLQSLAAGETITQVYTVTIRDDHGGSVAQQITITITGTNDGPTTNSAPVIVASETVATGDFTERTSPTPSTGLSLTDGANGTITFLDVDLTDTHTVNSSFVSALWTKNGITQPVSITDPGSIALTLHENPADTNNKGTIDWAYSVTDSRLDFLAAGETLVVTYNVSVADSSSSTVQPVTVTIHGTNDVPVITSSTQAGSVTEDADGSANENNENHTVTGTVTFTDVDLSDVETSSITNTVVTPSLANGYALTQAQQNALVNAFSIQSATHSSANGTGGIGWTYNIADSALDFLGANDAVTLTYTVQVADGHNGTATQDVTITVHGTDDAPVITSSTQAGSVTELADGSANENQFSHSTSGLITFTDVDLSDVETSSIANTVVNASLANGYTLTQTQHDALVNAFSIHAATHSSVDGTGRIGWTYDIADSALDFLGANDTVTLTYTVQVADGHNGTATQDVTITVHGTNDIPVITSSAQTGSVTEDADGSANENNENHTVTGTVTFTDVDLSDVETSSITNTVVTPSLANGYALTQAQQNALVNAFSIQSATHSSANGTGGIGWTYNIADSALDFLGANDAVTLTYTVQVADGHNGTATQDVTITVHGTDDAPVITSSTQAGSVTELADGSANENQFSHSTSGLITFTDVDLSDVETSSIANTVVNASLANGYTLTQTQHDALVNAFSIHAATHSSVDGTGRIGWTYDIADSALDFLGANDTVTLTYTVQVADGHNGTATQDVTITVHGTNDIPVITSSAQTGSVTEDADGSANENNENHTVTGTVTFTDVDLSDVETSSIANTVVNASLANGYALTQTQHDALVNAFSIHAATHSSANGTGGIGWTYNIADSALDFLGADDTVTLTYTVQVADGHNGTATQDVTITVHGTNDAPVITSSTQAGSVTEDADGSADENNENHTVTGTVTFTDVDLSDVETSSIANTVVNASLANGYTLTTGQQNALVNAFSIQSATHSSANGTGGIGWTYTIADSALDFLGANDTVTLTYTVQVADGHNGTATQDVTITVHGTDDAPVIATGNYSAALTEAANTTGGDLTLRGSNFTVPTDNAHAQSFASFYGQAGHGYVAAWSDFSTDDVPFTPLGESGLPLKARFFDQNGNPYGQEIQVNQSGGGFYATFASLPGNLIAITWASDGNGGGYAAYNSRIFHEDGSPATDQFSIVDGQHSSWTTTIGTSAGFAAAYDNGSGQLEVKFFGTDGHQIGPTSDFAAGYPGNGSHKLVALGDGGFAALFKLGSSLFVERFGSDGVPIGSPAAVNASGVVSGSVDTQFTAARVGPDSFIVTWGDGNQVHAKIYGDDGTIRVQDFVVNPASAGDDAPRVTALSNGNVVVGWVSNGHLISQIFDAQGVAIGDPTTVSTSNVLYGDFSIVADRAGGFTAAWRSYDASDEGVFARHIDSAGHATSPEMAINVQTAGGQLLSGLVPFGDGNLLIGWEDRSLANGLGTQIVAQQLSSPDTHTVTGTVTFTDVDLSDVETSSIANTVVNASLANGYTLTTGQQNALVNAFSIQSATHSSANGTGGIGWTYTIADSALDFLGANDTVTLTYTVQVADGHNGTATQDVTITVHGTNDVPVITSSTQAGSVTELADGSANENQFSHSTSGLITFTDVDLSDVETSSIANTVVNASLANGYALTTGQQNALVNAFSIHPATHSSVDGTGRIDWTYDIPDSALDFLGANDTVTLTYTLQVADGHNGTATQDVTITVHGTNDAPIVSTTPDIQRLSVPNPVSAGAYAAAQDAIAPVLSEDGRFVVFDSAETVPSGGSDNPLGDIYLYDRLTGETTTLTDSAHIPTRPTGELYSGFAISADGNLVAFKGEYPVDNSGGGPDHLSEIYVYNRTTNTTHVLTDPVSHTAYSPNDQVRISAGGLIVFTTNGYDPNTPVPPSVKVVNQAGTLLASVAPSDLGITDQSIGFGAADISGNGRYVTFWALSNDLNGNPTGLQTLYTYDRTSHAYQTLATSSATHDGWWASMSSDGQFVVYQSDGGTVGGQSNIFVWNRSSGQTQSITAGADSSSGRPSISSDGRYITFESSADNLVTGDTNGHKDTFIYDTQNNTFQILSLAGDGVTQGNADSDLASDVSAGGRFAAFGGLATNLASPNDPASQAGYSGVFIVDRSGGTVGVVAEDTTKPDVVGGTPNNTLSTHGAFKFSDADLSDAHTATVGNNVAIDTSRAPAGFVVPTGGLGTFAATVVENTADANSNGKIAWTYTVDNSLVQSLGAGQSVSQTYTVQIDDGHNGTITQTVRIIITGTNDAPVVSGAVTDTTVVEDGSVSTLNALANASDVDLGTVLAVVNVPTTLPAGVTYDSVHHTFSLDPSNATFQPLAAGEQRVVTVNYGVSDGSVTTPASVSWTVTGVNDAPVFSGTATGTAFVEQGSAVSVAANVTVSDVDSANYNGGSLTATVTAGGHQGDKLSVSNGTIISVDTGGTVSFDSDGAGGNAPVAIGHLTDNINSLTVSLNSNATDAAVIALTQAIQFSSNSDDPTADTRTVTFTLKDGGGHAGTGTDTTYFNANVNVTPVNDAPAFSGSYAGTDFVENGAAVTVAANVSVSDVDSTNYDHGKLTVALTSPALTGDTLAIAPNDHISLANVASGTAVMFDSDGAGGAAAVAIGEVHTSGANITVNFNSSATDAAVKALVEAIQFSSSSENPTNAVRTVTFTLQDGGGTDNSGHDTTSFQVDVGVTPVNDAPVNTVPGAQSVDEDTGLSMTGLSVGDVDAGSADITVNLAVGHGTINVLDNVFVNTGGIISGNGTASVTLTGSQSAIDATLAATNGVIYQADSNYSGQDTLTVTTDDGGNSGDGGALQDIDTVAITVNPVADAPVLMGPLAASLTDKFSGALLDPQKWTVAAPTLIGDVDDWSVTQANGVVEIHDRGYLQTVAGFTPTAATPLHISFTWSPSDAYLLVTDRTQGGDTPTGISFVGNWTIGDPGALVIFDRATGFSANTRVDASLTPGATYDVDITDDGSHQTFTVADHSTHTVVAALTSDFGGTPAGNLVSFSNREGADGQHTDTIDNVSISSAYQGVEDNAVTLPGLAAVLADPSETLSLTLTGFPAGTTFSTGTLQASTHLFLTAAQIASLSSNPLSMTPPADFNGPITLTVQATSTESDASSATTTRTLEVVITPVNDAPIMSGDPAGQAFVEHGNAVNVATNVSVSDIDNANFSGGSLTATVGTGWHTGDHLSLATNDYFTVDTGGSVMFDSDGAGTNFDAVSIGHLTNNGTSLTVDLNGNASADAVAALISDIQFSSTSHNPTADDRTVTFTLVDGSGTANGGHDTASFAASVSVTPVNDAPVIASLGYVPSQNLILNGSFESGSGAAQHFIGTAAGNVDDWTFPGGAGSVDIIDSAGDPNYAWQAAEGFRSLDMSGEHAGSITQSFATVVGAQYTVHFSLAASPGEAVNKLLVSVGSGTEQLYTFDSSSHTASDMGWTTQSYTFTATGTTTTLWFESIEDATTGQVYAGAALDNVSVVSNLSINGLISFTDPDTADTHTASFVAENNGAGYVGAFSLDAAVTESNGSGSIGWHFDRPLTEPAQVITQAYDVTISDGHTGGTVTQTISVALGTANADSLDGNSAQVLIGGAGGDTFSFVGTQFGAVTVADFAASSATSAHDVIQLDSGDFTTLIDQAHEANGSTVIDVGTSTITLANILKQSLTASDFHFGSTT